MAASTRVSMVEMSKFMLATCRRHAHAAHLNEDTAKVVDSNISILFLAPSVIQATFNEFVSISSKYEDCDEETKELFKLLKRRERNPFIKRWNKLAGHLNGNDWDIEKEPFCFTNEINTIRNELVHFKGDMLKSGKAPSAEIQHFLEQSSWPVCEDYPWSIVIITHPDLALWTYETTLDFCFKMPKLLNAEGFLYFENKVQALHEELHAHIDGMDLIMSDYTHKEKDAQKS